MAATSIASTAGIAGVAVTQPAPESFGSTTAINFYAISTVANLSALTQGSVDVWLKVSQLP